MRKLLAALIAIALSVFTGYTQRLLDPAGGGGPISVVTASASNANTSVAVAYSVRQLKTTYDHPAIITPPAAVTGFTNSTTPLLRVRRSFDNAQLDIGYDVNGNLDTMMVKYFVSGKVGVAGPTNPTANGFVSVWYDQSGNSRDALQTNTAQQPRIINAGVLEVNGGGVPGIAGVSGGMIGHGGNAYDTEPAGVNIYGIDADRTMNVVSQPRAWTNGTSAAGDGTYLIDRNGSTGIQDRPLTCLKAVNNNWSVQIRNISGDINSSYEGAVAISLNRSDNVTLMRVGDVYPLYVNGVFAGSNILAGENKMVPVRIGYGTNTSENVYYGEFLLFPSALSNADLTVLNNSQNVYFVLGPGAGTWTGLLSNSWTAAGNWSGNTVPTLLSEITIPAGAANAPLITTTQSVKKLTVASGAALTITGGNLNVSDTVTINGTVGGTGTLTMNGSLKQVIKGTPMASIQNLTINNTADTAVATTNININGILTINANAKFSALPAVVINNAAAAGTITGSGTVIVTRTAASADYQSQYKFTTNTLTNLTVNYAGAGNQTINLGVNHGNLAIGGSGTKSINAPVTAGNVTGNITVLAGTLSTGTFDIGSPTNRAISVSAGAVFNAGTSIITFGTGTRTLTINGTFQTANTAGFSGTTGTAVSSANGPAITLGAASIIEYNATGTQAVTARADYGNVTLNGGSKTIGAGTHTLAGSLVTGSGATYNGASNPVLNVGGNFINSGTFTSGTGTVSFTGTTAQYITSTTTPLVCGGAVTFSGAASTATLGVNISVAGNLTVSTGKTLDLDVYTANRTGAVGNLIVAGTLRLGANTGGQTGSNFPLNYGTFTPTGGTIDYDGSNAIAQTVFATTYNSLMLTNGSGTGTALKISTGSFAVNTGSFTINTGAQFTPAAANVISGSGTLTGSGIVDVTGTSLAFQYTITNKVLTNLTINYGGNQAIPAGTYAALNITGGGTKTLAGDVTVTGDVFIASGSTLDVAANGNDLTVGGSFTNNGTFTQRSAEVIFNGAGSQTISGSSTTTFYDLTLNKTADTVFVNSSINVTNDLTLGSTANAILYPSATTVFNNAASDGRIMGTGTIMVTRIATTADLRNQYKFDTYTFTNITVNYAGLGTQTINISGTPAIIYNNIVISGSGTKSLNAATTQTNVTGSISVTGSATFATAGNAMYFNNNDNLSIAAGATMDAGASVVRFGTGSTLTITGTFRTSNTVGFWITGSTTTAIRGTPTFAIGTASTIEYYASATQVISQRTDYGNVILTGGSKTMTAGTNTLAGSLTINSGVTYNGTTNNPTLNVAGNFTNGGTFNQGTNTVTFNGNIAQAIGGTTSPTAFSNSVIFSGSSIATLETNITIGANLDVNTGKTLDLGTYTCNRATAGGGALAVAGTLKLGAATGGRAGSNYPDNFNTNTLTNGTIEYNGSNAVTQTVYGGITYYNLSLTNGTGTGTAMKNSTASFVVNGGNFTIGINTRFVPAALNVISGTGTLTGYGAIDVTGASLALQYNITNKTLTNIIINYTGVTQTIAPGTYTSLFITGGGTKTLGGAVIITGDVDIESGSTLSVGGTNSLSVGGNWINAGTFTQGTGTVTLNGMASQTISGTVATTFSNLTVTNVSAAISVTTNINVSGTLNMSGTNTILSPAPGVVLNAASDVGTLTGTGKVQVTRIATTADFRNQYKFSTYTLANLTVEYAGAGAQTINLTAALPAINYSQLIISGSGTKTMDAAMSATNATGNITINSGTFSTGNFNIVSPANRTITVASAATLSAGTSVITFGATTKVLNLYGTFTTSNPNGFSGTTSTSISSAGTPVISISSTSTVEYNASGNQTVTFGAGANYGNLKISGSGTKTLASAVTITKITGDIWISAGTLSNNTGLAIAGNNDNTLTVDNNATLELYGTSVFPTGFGTFVVNNNSTVNYAGAAQNIAARQYGNLTTSGNAGKTLLGNITVNGNITVGGTGLTASGFTLTVLGNWINNATFTANTSTVLLNGVSGQIISGSTTPVFNNLTLDNAAGTSMSSAVTVTGALSLTDGMLTIGSNTLTINGTVSTTATNSFKANGSSNITLGGSGGNATFHMDETTDGTTNRLGTLLFNRTGNTLTMGNDLQATTLTLTNGKLIIGSNTFTLNGGLTSSLTNSLVANGSSNITFGGSGNTTFFLDQTTVGTTNRVGTLTVNRTGNTITMGATMPVQIATALTLTNGKFAIGANTLTVDGAVTSSATNSIVGSASSNITFGGSGNTTFHMDQTSAATRTLATLIVNRTGNVITMGNSIVSGTALTLTNGELAIVSNLLTINGTFTNSATNSLVANGSSNVTFGGTGSATICLDQTTDGTTNQLGTLIFNRAAANTLTMGSDMQTATALTLTSGDLIIGSNTLTVNGAITTTAANLLVANGSSNLTFGGSGAVSFFVDQATVGTTNRLGTLTVNRSGGTVTMSNALQIATALILTSGKLAIGSLTLTINGTVTSSNTNSIVSNASSNITFGGSDNTTFHLDQTTPGTTNRIATLIINRTGTVTMGNDMQTATALTLTSGKLGIGSNTLTINGTLANTAANCLVGNGSSNISIGGTGALGSNIFLDQTTIGTTNRLANLTYNRAQTITLGDTVEVTGRITPTNGTLATGNKLKLISNASGDALIAAGTGSYITGTVTVERFLPAKGIRKWRFMASPVTGATLADWKNEIHITGTDGAANGFDATTSNQASVYTYNETAITGDYNTGWATATNITNALTPGKGYRVFVRGDRTPGRLDGSVTTQNAVTLNTISPVNTGTINMLPTFTPSGTPANDGWNLMGNPYPAPIDWNAFHDAGRTGSLPDYSGTDYSHLDAVVYIYDPAGNGYTSFNAFSGAFVGSLTNGVIPSGAAFWVKASPSPSMSMKEIYKTTTASTGTVFKTEQEQKQFSIKLLPVTDIEAHDEAVIKYIDEATSGFDGYDIKKMYGADVNIATIARDATFLSANYKPFNGKTDSIMLSVGVKASGEYLFEFNDPDKLVAGLPVYLIDLYTNKKLDLRSESSYPFSVDINNALTKGNERFVIVVGDGETTPTGTKEAGLSSSKLFLFPTITDGSVSVNTGIHNNGSATIHITDISGKEMSALFNQQWDNGKISLDLSGYTAGTYFITIEQENKQPVTLRCVRQ